MKLRRLTALCGLAVGLVCAAPPPVPAQGTSLQRIPLFGDTELDVQINNGGAHFLPGGASGDPSGVVVISMTSGSPPAQPPVTFTRSGKRVLVTIARVGDGSSLPFVQQSRVEYSVVYPSRMKLVVHAFGGNVVVTNPINPVVVSDASGNVVVERPRAPVSVDNQSGNVTVHAATAALDLAADSGDVSADLDPSWRPRPIRMESGSGNLQLTVPTSFTARVDASTQSGTVHNALSQSASHASAPPVWLYTERGDVTIGFPQPPK